MRSRFRRIDADEFTIATLLPVQRFKKASAQEVWRESLRLGEIKRLEDDLRGTFKSFAQLKKKPKEKDT